jgi:hypothetical protein
MLRVIVGGPVVSSVCGSVSAVVTLFVLKNIHYRWIIGFR